MLGGAVLLDPGGENGVVNFVRFIAIMFVAMFFGIWLLGVGYWLLVVGGWLLVVGLWVLAAG